MRRLKSLRFLIYLAVLGAVLAVVERRQASYGHLGPAPDPKKQQLQGESLHELATVLLELYPEAAEPNLFMGKSLAERGKLHEARRYLEKSLEIDRRNEALLFIYARLLLDLEAGPEEIRPIVDEIRRYFPHSREMVEDYFKSASKGKIRFDKKDSPISPDY